MNPIVAVVDPALGVTRGHHAGIAERIACDRPHDIEIKYYVNQLCNESELGLTQGSGISVHKVFSQDFYQYFQARINTGCITKYVFTLAKEYLSVLEEVKSTGLDHVLLYHTLNWEHANALSLAIQMSGIHDKCISHKILLMFYPGMNYLGQITDVLTSLNFCIALKRMQKMENTELLTSCEEYSQSYSRLLGSKASIELHPNLLAKQRYPIIQTQINSLKSGIIMLYCGDAKVEKGFQKLPDRIKWFLQQCDSRARFIIQYNRGVNWQHSCMQDIEKEVKILAKTDSRIDLLVGYCSDETLHQKLSNVNLMVLDYDEKVYADKTSGLLWLAANYNIPILTSQKTWVMRESKKIGLPSTTWFKRDTIHQIEIRLKQRGNLNAESIYAKKICMPFWEWYKKSV